MMMLVLFLGGLILLLIGAEILVRGASRISEFLGISPLIVGLTVVAFGTSSPEMIVSIKSSLAGNAEIAMGNVVGSNIFNILFILGLAALIRPLKVYVQLIRWDVSVMIVVSIILVFLSLNGRFGRQEGLLFFVALLMYTLFQIWLARKGKQKLVDSVPPKSAVSSKPSPSAWFLNGFYIIAGLFLLTVGSNLLVEGAVKMAKALGVSELLIGLTIVSAGTSLPEVATSVMASIRGETDISVGNIVGSNIFNILGVSGLAGMVSAQGIPVSDALVRFDIPLMILVSFACLPVFFSGGQISRREGGIFFGLYIFYITYLIMKAANSPVLPQATTIILWIILPLTVILIVYETWDNFRQKNRENN